MGNIIKLKSSVISGKAPTSSDLALGEGAVNHTDEKLYFRHPSTGAVWSFSGGGSSDYIVQSSFASPYSYIGRAPAGTITTASGWTITRLTTNADGAVTATATASGAWSSRTSLSYT